MKDEASAQVAQALARGEDHDALHALRWSLVWSARAVARLAGVASDTAAVEAVFLLDDALTEAAELAAVVPGLLTAAEPGPDVAAYLKDRQRALADIRDRTHGARQELEQLNSTEHELRARLAELDTIRVQVAELRRLERLMEALDEIQAQQGAVEERLVLLREHANGAEGAVRLGSTELLRLTQEQLSRLAAPVREALERASGVQAELAAAEAELADAERDVTEASERLAHVQERLGELACRAEANRRLADALAEYAEPGCPADTNGGLEGARALVEDVETRLHDLDVALGRALDARDRVPAPGRSRIAWNDEGPAPHPMK
ncbi:hypothetical protein [Streptomyces sp. NPDC093568]|uniref:hypothetical protein n=1 Tax=Streptomyces sp. NPDC093568 TaxID=3366041 RepID=UPI00380E3280